MRIFRKKAAFNVLSKPHQSERCAFCAHRAQNSILKSTHFVLPEHKTVSPHHPRRAFCAFQAQNSAPHALPQRISRPAGAKQPTAPKRRRLCRRARRQTGVADFRVRRREIILIVISNDMRVGNDSSQAASVEFARRRRANYARSGLQSPSKMKGNGFAVPFHFRICTILSPPVPSSSRRWGGSCRR